MGKLTLCFFAICLTVAIGSQEQEKIVGGSLTTVSQYPYIAGLLATVNTIFMQTCGGTIINNRSILSAAHCFSRPDATHYRIRVGSSFASSGGEVHLVSLVIGHPGYNEATIDNDIGILRSPTAFTFGENVQVGRIAGPDYIVGDNQIVWAAGWGLIAFGDTASEELRHVQLRTVNQETCNNIYGNFAITENMLCAGEQGRGICNRDSGGPLAHNDVIVGVTSFAVLCAETSSPSGFARVSRYTSWIQANA